MATLNLRNPNGYDGQPGTQYKQGIVRFATDAEATAGTATNLAVTVAQLTAVSTGANFASPPVLGFGSTTPRPVHATTLSALGTTTINTSGAAATSIGTGGTGAVSIGNATGNTAITGTLTTSAGITATTGNITASSGNVSASGTVTGGTGVTATTGNLTATNGNLALNGAGNKLVIHASTAASDSVGTSAALDGASPSQLVVATTAVTAASKIFLSGGTAGGTQGFLSIGTIVPGVSFQILSSANGDTSTVNYLIVN